MTKRKRGGQRGNRNARKPGFYSRSLTTSEICEFLNITNSHSVDREIAVLRLKLKSILGHSPGNHRALTEAAGLLVNSYCANYQPNRLTRKQLSELSGRTFLPVHFNNTNKRKIRRCLVFWQNESNVILPAELHSYSQKGKILKSGFSQNESFS